MSLKIHFFLLAIKLYLFETLRYSHIYNYEAISNGLQEKKTVWVSRLTISEPAHIAYGIPDVYNVYKDGRTLIWMKVKINQTKVNMGYVIIPALPAIKRDILIMKRYALHVLVPDV
jgi:hypothetical protein